MAGMFWSEVMSFICYIAGIFGIRVDMWTPVASSESDMDKIGLGRREVMWVCWAYKLEIVWVG